MSVNGYRLARKPFSPKKRRFVRSVEKGQRVLADIAAATIHGVQGHPVSVEVHVAGGMPAFAIVGQPDAACREARDRVRAALLSSGFEWPLQRITVNLAPSGVPKSGAGLDLAIAIGLLCAVEELPVETVHGRGFLAELGLDGSLRPVPGALALVDAMVSPDNPSPAVEVVVAPPNLDEALLVPGAKVRSVGSLTELVGVLTHAEPWPDPPPPAETPPLPPMPDMADVCGQPVARHAIEVAAAGGHHVLMVGPPGAGKTMLAKRLPGLLPPLEGDDALEVTRIWSAAGQTLPPGGLIRRPPFRAPHHHASPVALIGGGSKMMRPGEISLASRGVLFLDELGEYAPMALDSLRQPIEDGVVRVSRAGGSATYPAHMLLVAAMNPCPCGMSGAPGACRCSPAARARYARRLSGPLLDRFDIQLNVGRPTPDELFRRVPGEPTAAIAERVLAARRRAVGRTGGVNARMTTKEVESFVRLSTEVERPLEDAVASGRLSARGLTRVRAVALTLADLDGADTIELGHVFTALALRSAFVGERVANA